MIGGLGAAIRLKNTNGRCLVNASINSLMNSHEIVKYLYERKGDISLNAPFSEIITSADESIANLLTAYTHDYINDNSNPDLDKFIFLIKNLDEIYRFEEIEELHVFLDSSYKLFSHSKLFKLDFFLGMGSHNKVSLININLQRVSGLYEQLTKYLYNVSDNYFIISMPENVKSQKDLTIEHIKCIKKLFKIAAMSTPEYVCTDILCYEVDESGFDHVVYYNLMDNVLTDDMIKQYRTFKSIRQDNDYIYVPFVLHFQKLRNNLGFDGTFKTYAKSYYKRIAFVKEQLLTYTEPWYQNKVAEYLEELEYDLSDNSESSS